MSARNDVARAARRLAEAGLLIGTAGNVSLRTSELVAVTGTGVVLGECTHAQVTLVTLDGEVVDGALAPTSELDLHLGVYADTDADRRRAHARAVLHRAWPACSTSCR